MVLKVLTILDMNGQRVQNAGDGSAATDLVTLQQMQAFVRGLSWKSAARVKSTGNITVSAPGATINGVTMVSGDRMLLASQTTGTENGIYVWNGSAVPATRALDADSSAEMVGAAIYVTEGTSGSDTAWTQTVDPYTLGSSTAAFTQFGGGTTVTAGNGLTGTSTFSVLLDTSSGLIVSGTGLKVDNTVMVRKYAANCAATTNPQTFTHALGTLDIQTVVIEVSSGKVVLADVTAASTTTVTVDFGGAPTASQYRVIVQA